jgi:CheY-like chemotaxis protein
MHSSVLCKVDAKIFRAMLLDLAMPEMDGFEFLDKLQKKRGKDFKSIALTFYNDPAVIPSPFTFRYRRISHERRPSGNGKESDRSGNGG